MTTIEFNYQLINLESKLSGFALSLTSNREDAKDLVQETMLKAIKYRNLYVENKNLQAWVYTIMKNSFINNYRKKIRYNTIHDHSNDMYFLHQNKDLVNATPDSELSAKEISKLIDSLNDNYKMLFKMHIEGYKYREIAKKMDINIGTVKSRIFFARKILITELKNLN